MKLSLFQQKVIKAVSLIPKGNVASYGQIALMLGCPRCAIQVGQALNGLEEDFMSSLGKIPWWRIINNAGRISIKGTKYHNQLSQKRLLAADGVVVNDLLEIDIEKYRFRPDPADLKKLNLSDDALLSVLNKYGL